MAEDDPHQPPPRLPLRVLVPTLVVLGALTLLATASIYVLGAVRAYVGGESLWSKGRATAVQHLRDFSVTRNPLDYAEFEAALAVPEGDRQAREALMLPTPDRSRARAGLLFGGNHPDDIDSMIRLFLWFGDRWLFRDALQAWTEGDALIQSLRQEAARMRPLVMAQLPPQQLEPGLQRVNQLGLDLQAQELRFSSHLGRAARQTELILMGGLGGAFVLMTLAFAWWMRQVLHQLRRHEHHAREAHRQWELAAQTAQLGLYQFDMLKNEVHMDARTAQMHDLGPLPVTVNRHLLHERMVPPDGDQVGHRVDAAVRGGDIFQVRYRLVTGDGEVRHLESIGRIDLRSGLAAGRGVGVVRDVSEEVLRAEHASQRDAAQRVAEAQRAFLSRLSHELRTPLNAVLGFAQLLQLDHQAPMSPQQRQQVAWILGAGQQLLRLVEDVMDLSKVESGVIDLKLMPTDVNTCIAACLPLVEGARQQAGVHIEHERPHDTPLALVDGQRLQQVVVNLLSNACKYNRAGGRVTVLARAEDEGPEACVLIEVSDTGAGMRPQDLQELFQPFKRLEAATLGSVEGTGLGLYIVQQLVTRMQGSVDVRSEPGVGSRFTVRLPACGSGSAQAGRTEASALRA
jgi:signal transduction histidine kinase